MRQSFDLYSRKKIFIQLHIRPLKDPLMIKNLFRDDYKISICVSGLLLNRDHFPDRRVRSLMPVSNQITRQNA